MVSPEDAALLTLLDDPEAIADSSWAGDTANSRPTSHPRLDDGHFSGVPSSVPDLRSC